jgi:hypothetical protein
LLPRLRKKRKVGILLKKALGFVLFAALLAAPAGAQMMSAQSMPGAGSLQYYVGSWSCEAGAPGKPPSKATATFTLDAGVLRQWVTVPPTGKMKNEYAVQITEVYDAKNKRYVQTGLGNDGSWWVDFAAPWTGNTEKWVDHATSTMPLGHSMTVRTDNNHFSFESYPSMTAAKPNFKGTCTRSS